MQAPQGVASILKVSLLSKNDCFSSSHYAYITSSKKMKGQSIGAKGVVFFFLNSKYKPM